MSRIEINLKINDGRANSIKEKLNSEFGNKIKSIRQSDLYSIDENLNDEDLQRISDLVYNSVSEEICINSKNSLEEFDFSLEIGFLPGVTDNCGKTFSEVIKNSVGKDCKTYSSKIYYIKGDINRDDVEDYGIFLSNPLIQRAKIQSLEQFKTSKIDNIIPAVNLNSNVEILEVPIINSTDEDLINIGKKGILDPKTNERRGPLALDLDSMKTIQKYFKEVKNRNPTDIEVEALAQTWSEHCKHTIFASEIDELKEGLYKGYIKKATNEVREELGEDDFCVSVFSDNSGVIKFDENNYITDKAETHNSPSALDPFGGSITGIVGVNRDTIGCAMGAMPVINSFGFCLADPREKYDYYRQKNRKDPILSSFKIMDGVINGVENGGNQSGIPTIQGFMNFHGSYCGKPLVFVRTVGIIPKQVMGKDSTLKEAQVGDNIVVIGGRVGIDGIHGATFSSEAIDSGSPATAVQIGDPITQKKLSDAVVKEARDLGLYNSITDNGAGGISCSVAEMARECGGCEVQLEKVPLKYPGLSPWEIWISESQERMTLSIPDKSLGKFQQLMEDRGVEVSVIGKFTNSGSCVVKHFDNTIMDLDLEFLHNGQPLKKLESSFTRGKFERVDISSEDTKNSLKSMISRLNCASIDFIDRQYDHEVGAGSVLKPIVGEGEVRVETSVTRPNLKSNRAVAISQSLYPRYGRIDTYNMSACAIDSAIRNLICVGVPFKKIALMDNFCWCSSNEKERLGQLKRAVRACYDYSKAYLAPYISGKDSMFNDFKGFDPNDNEIKISANPTLLISSIGVIEDYREVISQELKFPGDLLYVIGDTNDELGGSEYLAYLGESKNGEEFVGDNVPEVNSEKNSKIYERFSENLSLISSAMPVNLGGLGVSIAKVAIGGNLGVNLDLTKLSNILDINTLLFSESSGRIIVSIDPKNREKFEEEMNGISINLIGEVMEEREINIKHKNLNIKLSIDELKEKYKETFRGY